MNSSVTKKANEVQSLSVDRYSDKSLSTVTPDKMLLAAVEQGADLEKLEKLMALQERWEATQAKKAYVSAMSQFKSKPPKLIKNAKVKYKTDRGVTEYNHATLGHICDAIGKGLGAVGISFRWVTRQENGVISVTCVMTHDLGHSEGTTLHSTPDASGGKNSIQAVGSAVTYLQRYTLLAATGLATEDQDNDGADTDTSVFITQEQIEVLNAIADEVGVDEKYICEKARIPSIDKLPSSRFEAAKNHLRGLKQ